MNAAIVSAALAAGLPVFPCRADKAPATPHGFKDAAPAGDAAAIAALWRRYPGPLIGVPTGAASGLFIVDIDPAGRDWFYDAVRHAWFPATRVHRTRRGGYHLIYRQPGKPALGNSAGKLFRGVDTRGTGGYVIWPPSPGYTIENDDEIAQLPRWISNRLRRPNTGGAGGNGTARSQRSGGATRPAGAPGNRADALVRFVAGSRPGERNARLFWAACRAVELGYDPQLAARLLAAALGCGLDEAEARRTLAGARRTIAEPVR